MAKRVITAPSILSADFTDIGGALKTIEDAGADWVHLDVMDGHFVPNLTFGPGMVGDIRKHTHLPLDVHLMVEGPERMVDDYLSLKADYITFHQEATVHSHRLVQHITSAGAKAGISIVPSTPVSAIEPLLDDIDLVLVMTVNPGFGGQRLIPQCVEKVRLLDAWRREHSHSFLISVDGGINIETVHLVRQAGVDVIVSGSSFFSAPDRGKYLLELKGHTSA